MTLSPPPFIPTDGWVYADSTDQVVIRTNSDGSTMSMAAAALPHGTVIAPALPAVVDTNQIAKQSFAAGLRGKAATLSRKGNQGAAMNLLLEAQRIDPHG